MAGQKGPGALDKSEGVIELSERQPKGIGTRAPRD